MAVIDEEVRSLLGALNGTPLAAHAAEAERIILLREDVIPGNQEQRILAANGQLEVLESLLVTALKQEREAMLELRELAPRFGVERVFLRRDPDMLIDKASVLEDRGWDQEATLSGDGFELTDGKRVEAIDEFLFILRSELEAAAQRVRQRESGRS